MSPAAALKDNLAVLVAGIGGASLGTEVAKALHLAGRYRVLGADISPHAYGHFDAIFERTWRIDEKRYIENILEVCQQQGVKVIVPGGERPMLLLMKAEDSLKRAGVHLAGNRPDVVLRASDKRSCFETLQRLGIEVPFSMPVDRPLLPSDDVPFPCIIKPATESGGSASVSLARDLEEANIHVGLLLKAGKAILLQEYVPADEGEFTICVLHLPDGRLVGSIALRRMFHAKLSVAASGPGFLISSGNSQGLIDDFPAYRAAAEQIATALGSRGPLNVQGRVRRGRLVPFEVNPRFSASTYLRAMAGFNELDIYLRAVFLDESPTAPTVKRGFYLRSFAENFVPLEAVGG